MEKSNNSEDIEVEKSYDFTIEKLNGDKTDSTETFQKIVDDTDCSYNTSIPNKPQFGSFHQRTLSEQIPNSTPPDSLVKKKSKRFSLNNVPTYKDSTDYDLLTKKVSSTPASPSANKRVLQIAKIPENQIPTFNTETDSQEKEHLEREGEEVNYIQGTDLEVLLSKRESFRLSNESGSSAGGSSKNLVPPSLPVKKSPKERRFGQISISPTRDSLPLSIDQVLESGNPSVTNLPSKAAELAAYKQKLKDSNGPSTKIIVQKLVNDFSQLEAGCEPVWQRCEQSINTAKLLTRFFRRRAALEEDYGKNMLKLLQMTSKEVEKEDMPEGTFCNSFKAALTSHEDVGKNRIKLASQLYSLTDELTHYAKEKEALRKAQKETGARLKKNIAESELSLEKTKIRFLQTSEAWDKAIVHKLEQSHLEAEQAAFPQPSGAGPGRAQNAIVDVFNNIFSQNKTDNLRKQEEELKAKATAAKRLYHQNHNVANHMRHDYYTKQLPDLISESLSVLEEMDQANKSFVDFYTSRYLTSIQETNHIISSQDLGLRSIVDIIDVHDDNLDFFSSQLGVTRPVNRDPYSLIEYSMSKTAQSVLNPKTVYGMSLQEQLSRDGTDLPVIVEKCVKYIEKHGMLQEGIYRRSGSSVKVNRIRDLFNLDANNVDLENLDVAGEVDNVAGALKLYLRELPEAVVPSKYWPGFLFAHHVDSDEQAQIEALRIALEKLPRVHFKLLEFIIVHLSKVAAQEEENKMTISNISIVFGPTLFPPAHSSNAVELMGQQCGVTMLLLSLSLALFNNSL